MLLWFYWWSAQLTCSVIWPMVELGKLQLFVCERVWPECTLYKECVTHMFECTLKQGFDWQLKVTFFKLLPILSHTKTWFYLPCEQQASTSGEVYKACRQRNHKINWVVVLASFSEIWGHVPVFACSSVMRLRVCGVWLSCLGCLEWLIVYGFKMPVTLLAETRAYY